VPRRHVMATCHHVTAICLIPDSIFNNKKIDRIVREDYKRLSLKEATKARLTAIVTIEAST
jgi:hypothetical protein